LRHQAWQVKQLLVFFKPKSNEQKEDFSQCSFYGECFRTELIKIAIGRKMGSSSFVTQCLQWFISHESKVYAVYQYLVEGYGKKTILKLHVFKLPYVISLASRIYHFLVLLILRL